MRGVFVLFVLLRSIYHILYIFNIMSNVMQSRSIATLALASLLVGATALSCKDGGQTAPEPAPADSIVTDTVVEAPVVMDTLRGRVTDATSRTIEMSVVMDLELPDEMETPAEVGVGRDVEVVLRHEADGTQTVVSVRQLHDDD